MDFDKYLNFHSTLSSTIVNRVKDYIGLDLRQDVLFFCGSLIEGLGNKGSDLDVYLFTSRKDIELNPPYNTTFIMVNDIRCDINIFDFSEVENLVLKLENWINKPRLVPTIMQFSNRERLLLHRIRTGMVLHGAKIFQKIRNRVPQNALMRQKLDLARHLTNSLQIDLAGMKASCDWVTMVYVAQNILDHCIDAFLAAHGFTNPSWKWRSKLLDRLPDGSAFQFFAYPPKELKLKSTTYHILRRAPAMISTSILDFTHRIVQIARTVMAWSEQRILAPNSEAPIFLKRFNGDNPLPLLALDVTVQFEGGRFHIYRFSKPGSKFGLSARAFSLLSLFDGKTSKNHALLQASRLWGQEQGSKNLDDLIGLVCYGNFIASPAIDDDKINSVLETFQF
ncbi:MAG: hypothetical protein QNJ38_07375 [Prochloraceae cyanobacterium]|nr:hypothetical protein [Prochloraceae cyanobacterium]